MKKSFILLLCLFCAFIINAQTLPEPQHKLYNDYVGLVNQSESNTLNNLLLEVNDSTSVEFTIVVIKSLNGSELFTYAQDLFQKWGIGKKGKDNGILLLISLDDHKLRFHTGYGAQTFFTDIKSKEILDEELVPYMKSKKYYDGLVNVISAVKTEVKRDKTVLTSNVKATPVSESSSDDVLIILVSFIFGCGVLAVLFYIINKYIKAKQDKKDIETKFTKLIESINYTMNIQYTIPYFNDLKTEYFNKNDIPNILKKYSKSYSLESIQILTPTVSLISSFISKLNYDYDAYKRWSHTKFYDYNNAISNALTDISYMNKNGEQISSTSYEEKLNSLNSQYKYYYDKAVEHNKANSIDKVVSVLSQINTPLQSLLAEINGISAMRRNLDESYISRVVFNASIIECEKQVNNYLSKKVGTSAKSKLNSALTDIQSFKAHYSLGKEFIKLGTLYASTKYACDIAIRAAKKYIDDQKRSSSSSPMYYSSPSDDGYSSSSSSSSDSTSSSSSFDFGGGSSGGSGSDSSW